MQHVSSSPRNASVTEPVGRYLCIDDFVLKVDSCQPECQLVTTRLEHASQPEAYEAAIAWLERQHRTGLWFRPSGLAAGYRTRISAVQDLGRAQRVKLELQSMA